jgi:hypothetical protein
VSKDEAKKLTRVGASVVGTGLFLLLLSFFLSSFFVAMVGESLGESLQQWSDRKISRVLGLKKNWMGELDSVVQASIAAAT